jgi:capsular polysaccharide transport system ATP-binding protein
MITVEGMSKSYVVRGHETSVFVDVGMVIPTDRCVALFGAEASGKSALIRMLSGVEGPTRGVINRLADVSFPVGSLRILKPHLTARQNIQHVARAYGVHPEEAAEFARAMLDIGTHFDEPVVKLPSGLRGAVAWAITYSIPFDSYLIDENVGYGPEQFRERCAQLLQARAADRSGYILATSRPPKARPLCDCAIVIADRRLHWFDDMNDAEDAFEAELARISAVRRTGPRELAIDEPWV